MHTLYVFQTLKFMICFSGSTISCLLPSVVGLGLVIVVFETMQIAILIVIVCSRIVP